MRHNQCISIIRFIVIVFLFFLSDRAFALDVSVGPNGINAKGLGLTGKRNGNLLPRISPTPDLYREIPLQDHVVRENLWKVQRLGGGNAQQHNCRDNERANSG